MKQNARIAAQSRNFILYLLIALMVVTGVLSQETRAQSEFLTATESAQASVYRLIPGMPLTDEPCTEKMIGAQTKLPVIRAFRPLRRAFRALLSEIYVCAVTQTTHQEGFCSMMHIRHRSVRRGFSQPFNTSMIWMEKNPHNFIDQLKQETILPMRQTCSLV